MIPRGIRNNNPTNIRYVEGITSTYAGCTGSDGAFCIFDTPEHGIGAAAKLLTIYRTKHGIDTLRGVINRWAPPSENDTGAYLHAVCEETGYGPDDKVDLTDPSTLAKILPAIIRHENGSQPYTDAQIAAGVGLTPPEPPMADEPSFSLGSALKTAAGPATLLNPVLGAGLGLAGFLVDAFAPLAREKIVKEIGRHTDSPEVAAQFADGLIGAAQKLTKQADPIQAVATARADPALLAQLEQKAVMKLEQMLPLFDKLAKADQEAADREIASADAAGERGRKDSVDLGPLLTKAAIGVTFYILTALFGLIGMSIWKDPTGSPDMSLVMISLQIILPIAGLIVVIVGYRFGRAANNSAAAAIASTLSSNK